MFHIKTALFCNHTIVIYNFINACSLNGITLSLLVYCYIVVCFNNNSAYIRGKLYAGWLQVLEMLITLKTGFFTFK